MAGRIRFRMVPAMMLVAGMSFTVRIGDFIYGWHDIGSAQAQQEVKASPPPMTPETTSNVQPDKAAADKQGGPPPLPDPMAQKDAGAAAASAPSDTRAATDGAPVVWKDATDTEVQDSTSKADLYKDLAKRRADLDKREKEIAVREALLSAAEKELDQKTRELTTLKTQIEADLKTRDDAENARIASLVKIYETMKPKDAATIFNSLDMDVLMVIMTKMSERKSAPILALMTTERAKTITTMMAEQKKTPELPTASN